VRVPLIVDWPGTTPAGTECETPVITMDLYPTILEMTRTAGSPEARVDGLSLAPLLRQDGQLAQRDLFWHYPHYQHYQKEGTTPYGAIRRGDWKLIEFYDDKPAELYNLQEDISERHDIAASEPELAKSMLKELRTWLRHVDAQMPIPNPNYDPTRPEYTPQSPASGAKRGS
jgi:arylsulfatase A-like enzyme